MGVTQSNKYLSTLVTETQNDVKELEKKQQLAEFYKSLSDAIISSGGTPKYVHEGTTLSELANSLAHNGIRFAWVGKLSRGVQ